MVIKTWIIGCGDIGRRVSKIYHNENVCAVVRSQKSIDACKQLNIITSQIDLDLPYTLDSNQFKNANIFYFAPPPSTGKNDTRLKNFLKAVGSGPSRIVLISTTGVYGDSQGEWIDESTPTRPDADRAHRRLSAEKNLQEWAANTNKEYIILRVPGIYAQDRLPLARLQKGLAVVNANEAGWTNRIHADDLAQVCKAAMFTDKINQVFNVTDGNPSTMTEYFNQVADYAKLPRPPQISMKEAEATLSEGMVSYLKESRRIKNTKMLNELNVILKYPTLKSALKASH